MVGVCGRCVYGVITNLSLILHIFRTLVVMRYYNICSIIDDDRDHCLSQTAASADGIGDLCEG